MNANFTNTPAMAKIVNQQMRNWEFAKSQKTAIETPTVAGVRDFICLSREIGAGGADLGRKLAEKHGWPVFDREVLHFMAGDDQSRENIYTSMDEHDLSWLEEMLRAVLQPDFEKNDYLRQLGKTILSLARQGPAVFIGRGADHLLPRDAGLRVRIIAPLEQRIRTLMQRQSLTEQEAQREIDNLEHERTRFIHKHFRVDVADPHNYDLVLNLAVLSDDSAIDLIDSARRAMQHVDD